MKVSSSHQGYVFLLFVFMGIVCGMIFDTQRTLRKNHFAGTLRTTLEDGIFVILSIGIIIGASFVANNGEIRYFQAMGVVSGALFYAAFLSRIFRKSVSAFLSVITKILLKPIARMAKFLTEKLKRFAHLFKKRFMRIKRRFAAIRKTAKKRRKIIKKRVKML